MLSSNIEKPSRDSTSLYQGSFSYLKAGALFTVCAVIALVSGLLLRQAIFESGNIWYAVAALVVLLVSAFLFIICIAHRTVLLSGLFLFPFVFVFSFFQSVDAIVGGSALVGAVLWISSGISGRKALNEMMSIHFWSLSRTIFPRLVFSLAIFAAVAFFIVFSIRPLDERNPIFPKSFFEASTGQISSLLKPILGDLDFSLSLRQISEQAVLKAAKEAGTQLSGSAQTFLVNEVLNDYQEKFTGIFKAPLHPDKKLSESVYDAILSWFQNLDERTRKYGILGLSVLMLLAVQALSPLLRLFLSLVSFAIYQMFILAGFIAIVYENRSKEMIALP